MKNLARPGPLRAVRGTITAALAALTLALFVVIALTATGIYSALTSRWFWIVICAVLIGSAVWGD